VALQEVIMLYTCMVPTIFSASPARLCDPVCHPAATTTPRRMSRDSLCYVPELSLSVT
jgi:hypothetical protein